MEVKERKLGDLGVDGGELAVGVAGDAGLLIAIGESIKLDDFANEDSGRVSGVRAFTGLE